jgi:N-acetylmuramoyl-L-alanine amidase
VNKTVFLSAGHSDVDPGAVGHNRREADVAVEMRNIVSFYLNQAGIFHELDGVGTSNLPLRDAVKKAARHPIGVEFHCNASDDPRATGTETLSALEDRALAADLSAAIAGSLGLKNRAAKPENAGQHHRLAFVQAGGIIVELFFISNAFDLQRYDARKWLAGRAIADVLIAAAKQ